MILDLILIALLLIFIIIGCRRGAMATVAGLVMSFAAYLVAAWAAKLISVYIYTNYILTAIRDSVGASVRKLADGTISSLNEVIDSLPPMIKLLVGASGDDLKMDTYYSDMTAAATDIVDKAVRPVAVGFLSIVLTVLLFIVLSFIFKKLLLKPLLKTFDIPVLSGVNRFFGGVIGAVEGVLAVCMLAYLLRLILPYTDSSSPVLNESTIYNSFIFYHFYSGNIFTMLSSWIA